MYTLRVIPIGRSLGVILPERLIARLKLEHGGALFVLDGPDGLHLSTRNPGHGEQLRLGHALMHERHAVLQQLAL